jgi:hypothetical protein
VDYKYPLPQLNSKSSLKIKLYWMTVLNWLNENRRAAIRIPLIIVVLSASAFIAPMVALGDRKSLIVILVILAVVGFLFILRQPTFGLIGVVLGSMFIPFSGPGGFNISQIGIAVLIVIWLLDTLVIKRRFQIIQSRAIFAIFIFIIITILSFLFGQIPWYPFSQNAPIEAQLGGMAIFVLSAGAFLMVPYLVNNYDKLKYLTWAFIGFGSAYVIGRFLNIDLVDRIYLQGASSGSMFWTWLVSLLVGQALTNQKLQLWKRVLLVGIILMTLYDAIIQAYDWKSGWLPPLVSIMAIFGIHYWKRIRYFLILAIIPIYYIISVSVGAEDYSWGTRLDAWIIVLNIVQVSPILGMGFANYYWYTALFPIRGWYVRFNSHSQYVDLIAQTGVLGLACYIWFFVELGVLGLRLIKNVPEGFPKGYLFGALGGIAGTIVAGWLVDWVLPFTYNIGMSGFRASILAWIFMGGILTIEQMVRRQT